MSDFWNGALFGAFVTWLGMDWASFIRAGMTSALERRENMRQFRRMDAAASVVVERLTDREKAAIRADLYR